MLLKPPAYFNAGILKMNSYKITVQHDMKKKVIAAITFLQMETSSL